jgi:DNA-binding IclR family transcriptional regulator
MKDIVISPIVLYIETVFYLAYANIDQSGVQPIAGATKETAMPKTRKSAGADAGLTDRYRIDAVDRALQVLELLAAKPGLRVTDLAEMMNVSKALAFRLLHTLELRDYVRRDPQHRSNTLGFRVLHLAEKVEAENLLIRTTAPLMDALAELCREDVNLYVRTGITAVCIASRASPHQVRMFAEVGRENMLHAGGSSTVLLAYAPDDVQHAVLTGELRLYTPLTLVDPAKLRQRLHEVRANGFHVARADVDEAGFSIAAPVFGHDDEIVAAVSIAGALTRLTDDALRDHIDMVRGHARRMSKKLGGTRRQ